MKIFLIKDSKLLADRAISHNNDFSVLEHYLETKTNYSKQDFESEEFKTRNGKQISELNFKETFDHDTSNGSLDVDNVNLYDAAVIYDYPFFKGLKTFWRIENKKINSSGQFVLSFVFDSANTFGTGLLPIGKRLKFERRHINYEEQFEDSVQGEDKKILRDDSIFIEPNLMPNLQILPKEKNILLESNIEKELREKLRIKYWMIATVGIDQIPENLQDLPSLFQPTVDSAQDRQNYIPTVSLQVMVPVANEDINIVDYNGVERIINAPEAINNLLRNIGVQDIRVIDYPQGVNWKVEERDGKDFIVLDPDPANEDYVIDFSADGEDAVYGIVAAKISNRRALGVKIQSEEDLKIFFDYEEPDRDYTNEETLKWKPNQVLDMNFYPFKEFEIGFITEKENSGWKFNLNMLRTMPNLMDPIFYRMFAFSEGDWTTIDTLFDDHVLTGQDRKKDVRFGSGINKIKRMLQHPVINDEWREKQRTRALNGLQNVLLPQAFGTPPSSGDDGFLRRTANKAKTRARRLAGSLATTAIQNKKAQLQPDKIQGSADLVYTEMLGRFDSKTLTVHEINDREKEPIAYEIHVNGTYTHDTPYLINSIDELLPRDRFNVIKLSEGETSKNIKFTGFSSEVILDYLGALTDGRVFWEWENVPEEWETGKNNHIFDYEIKNPTKEAPNENDNVLDAVLEFDL